MQDPKEAQRPADNVKNHNDSTLNILSSLAAIQSPLPTKNVHFPDPDEDPQTALVKTREFTKTYPEISNNHLSELHLAILNNNQLGIRNVRRKVGEENFRKLLQMPSPAKYSKGYKAVHFIAEEEKGSLIGFFHNTLKADFSLTVDYESSEYYGLTALQLAVYRAEAKVLEKFGIIPQLELSGLLHTPCLKGKFKGFQALHIALMRYSQTDTEEPESFKEYYKQNRKLVIENLSKLGANLEAVIDNPDHAWHGKTALKISELLGLNLEPTKSVSTIGLF